VNEGPTRPVNQIEIAAANCRICPDSLAANLFEDRKANQNCERLPIPLPPQRLAVELVKANADGPKAFSGSSVARVFGITKHETSVDKLRTVLKDSSPWRLNLLAAQNLFGISVCSRNEIWHPAGAPLGFPGDR